MTPAINLGFPFKFYEQSYTQIYISSAGVAGFDRNSLLGMTATYYVPSPSKPNNMIAPFLTIFRFNSAGYTGHVYYLRGGSAPNRYFVMQWQQVHDTDSSSSYTFQAVLYENGTIDFSYQNVTYADQYWCGSATAIENATGFDGLAYIQTAGCNDMRPMVGRTVRFYHPAPSARANVWPKVLGAFAAPGDVAQMSMQIRNLGELGADSYDISASSLWPVAFYQADGVTPLTDTNSDNTVDTGSIAQGATKTIIVQMRVPASAAAGDSDRAQLSVWPASAPAYSRGVTAQVAVPAPFVQSDVRGGQPGLLYNRVGRQNSASEAGATNSQGPAVATTPAGDIVQVWSIDRTNAKQHPVRELYFAIRDRYGNSVRAATKLTDYSSATLETYDLTPAVAVASDGNIAIVWYQLRWNPSNSSSSTNIYIMLLNSAGNVIAAATNLSGNSQSPVTNLYRPSVAAVAGNRFVFAWSRQQNVNNALSETVIYAVRTSTGSAIKPPTEFSGSTNTCSKHPNLSPLADGSALLIYEFCSQVNMGRIDSAGNITLGTTAVPSLNGDYPDAVQLANGNIVIATSVWWMGDKQKIEYVVINSANSLVKSATDLSGISLSGDDFVSLTRAGQRAVLTWEDSCSCGYQPYLYYALLDDAGELVTDPMIFTSDAGYALGLPYNGQGNTSLPEDTTAPANPTSLSSSSHQVNDWSSRNEIQVYWSGASDADSGLDGYAVAWDHSPTTLPGTSKTLEQDVNTLTSAALADGTWYFHIRTVDNAGNWAASAVHLGPFMISTTGPRVIGMVTNNRSEPVFNAQVTSNPPARNTAHSDLTGHYTLFYTTTGVYTLTVQRAGFGAAQALNGLTVNGIITDVNLVLPPQVDAVSNGAFESPVAPAWSSGAQISATAEVSAAHTGQSGLDLQSHPAPGVERCGHRCGSVCDAERGDLGRLATPGALVDEPGGDGERSPGAGREPGGHDRDQP